MRGALGSVVVSGDGAGIIPADAESTFESSGSGPGTGDHPRGCGEHPQHRRKEKPRAGSSPRMRGAPLPDPQMGGIGGIIPADAGSTPGQNFSICNFQDHPRGCGEHLGGIVPFPSGQGSSPRMRGARCCLRKMAWFMRIIPADAGSTSPCICDGRPRGDHPRGCGEHALV